MKRSLLLLTMALGQACTSVPGPGSSSSSSSSGSSEPAVFGGYRAVLFSICNYYERCAATLGPAYSSVEACQRAQAVQVQLDHVTHTAESHVYNVDTTELASCLDGMEHAACAPRVPPELLACQDALSPKTPRDPGQQCSTGFDEAAPRCSNPAEAWCVPAAPGCGTCALKGANGAECTINEQCLSGYCGAALIGPRHCEAIPAGKFAGNGCLDGAECNGNLVCAGPFLQKVCSRRVAAGQPCSNQRNGDLPECVQDLVCVSGVCAQPLQDGQTCSRNPGAGPQCATFCIFPTSDAAQGTCGMPSAMPGATQPCVLHTAYPSCGGDGNLFTDERFTGTANALQSVSCVCSPRQSGATPCFENEACLTGTCTGATGVVAGNCTTPSQDGATCTAGADCVSGVCSNVGGMRQCAAAAVCQ